jgi:hypothetical protein
MKPIILIAAILFYGFATAQTVNIPDPYFEQALITKGIDSDGIVNGMVLANNVANVTQLILDAVNDRQIASLTGLEAFSNLETFIIGYSGITTLNVSSNTMLKTLNCRSNSLTAIDLSTNLLLENLYIGNDWDLGPFNNIFQLDLSNNPNIKFVEVSNLAGGLDWINLKNGNNNPDMEIQLGYSLPAPGNTNVICIEVDNQNLATSNQFPYSEWNVRTGYNAFYNFSDNCTMSIATSNVEKLKVYPNPVSDVLYFTDATGTEVSSVKLYDISGRQVKEYNGIVNNSVNVSGLAKGIYIVKIFSGNAAVSRKIIVE